MDYKSAGVDIDLADKFVERIKRMVGTTHDDRVVSGVGGFAALYHMDEKRMLAASTDGIGTKIKLAIETGKHDTIGIDLVAMCVNDLLCTGARPLFFLDYFATGKLELSVGEDVLKGIVAGCKQGRLALIGGETAEMPGMYAQGDYDLAGFSVGEVFKDELLDGSQVKAGQTLIGLASSGFHSNGYSLVRKLLERADNKSELTLQALTPTRIYVDLIHSLTNRFLALVGGDHGQGLGTVHGLLHHYPDLLVVWIDAHADANVPSASPTGNMHGMPLSWLLGASEGKPWWLTRTLSSKRLIYIGARDLDPYERMLIEELDITVIKPQEADWQRVIRRELDRIDPHGNCPVHISLDVDALDATLVPSTGTPVHNGLTHAQIESALDVIQEERKIVATEIVEINPELGDESDARELCAWARDIFMKVTPSVLPQRIPWQARALRWWD